MRFCYGNGNIRRWSENRLPSFFSFQAEQEGVVSIKTAAIIDADLIGKARHKFPNLACMKLSAYYKSLGYDVELKTDYNNLENYDVVTISKVFIDTVIPFEPEDKSMKNEDQVADFYKDNPLLKMPNVIYGGTGFYYDKAPNLAEEIEHIKPDYHLYDEWVQEKLSAGGKPIEYKYYTDYSIGFTTRGCFRKCKFCVNRNYNRVFLHSAVEEFSDETRKKICLLDDNLLGYPKWKEIIRSLQDTGKPFQYKQGLDARLLTEETCDILFKSRYDGDYIFAFDDYNDRELIEEKAYLIRRYNKQKSQNVKFYLFCGYDREEKYDTAFWKRDICQLFERIFILAKYNFLPFVMRHQNYLKSEFFGTYINITRWCNQPAFFKNVSLSQFCKRDDERCSGGKGTTASWRYYQKMFEEIPESRQYLHTIPKELALDYSKW